MRQAERVETEYFNLEVMMSWLALNLEFSSPEELARLEKCKWRKGELMFDEIQEKLKIPPGDPFTVAKAIGDYLTKVGYAKVEIHKVSDTELWCDMGDLILLPMLPTVRSLGGKMDPEPATTLFTAALKKLCNVKVEHVRTPEHLRASVPEGMNREVWHLSPLS